MNIADKLCHLCGVLNRRLRSNAPVPAELGATINKITTCIIQLPVIKHDTT